MNPSLHPQTLTSFDVQEFGAASLLLVLLRNADMKTFNFFIPTWISFIDTMAQLFVLVLYPCETFANQVSFEPCLQFRG